MSSAPVLNDVCGAPGIRVPAPPAGSGAVLWYPWVVRIALLEPYFTGSHRQWAEGLRDHSIHQVCLLTHEGRFWKWRLGGGFVTMAEVLGEEVARRGGFDLILGTSMLDLAGLLGTARRAVAGTPAAIYFHENQVTYPATGRTRAETTLGMVNWASLLAADGAAFNSRFHLEAFFGALPTLLGAAPDQRHDHLIPAARRKSAVVPVGVDLRRIGPLQERRGPATFLWNHRWDPDKAIGTALEAFGDVAATGVDFRVILAGEAFVNQAEEHRHAVSALGGRVVHVGHLEEAAYLEALHRADAVVSTARQEFFGVSVVEGMYAGALPIVPDRLVYPERVPPGLEGRCLYRTRRQLVDLLQEVALDPAGARRLAPRVRAAVEDFDWSTAGPRTDAWLESVVQAG